MYEDIKDIMQCLRIEHPKARCELKYNTPFELLVAVVLSAQSTDKQVNKVTAKLFEQYNTPEQFAGASVDDIAEIVKSCGCYRTKANSIIELSRSILMNFNGEVPHTIEELMTLRGVGRKTANVVYAEAFGGDAIAVDTHVHRVSNRIGLVHTFKVEDTETGLQNAIPKEHWSEMHHLLIHHGRYTCKAHKPSCRLCSIVKYCKYNNKFFN